MRKTGMLFVLSVFLCAGAKAQESEIRILRQKDMTFTAVPAANFDGRAVLSALLPRDNSLSLSAGLVEFAPGACTAWHTHPNGQLLIIAKGVGRVQREGSEIIKVYAGDIVWFPAGVKHWHGAAEDSEMSHYAFAGIKDGKSAEWFEKVSE